METHNVKLSKEGRVLIPIDVRQSLGLQEGSNLSLRVENGEIRLFDKAQALRRAQAIALKFKQPKTKIVDQLINERRAQSIKE